MTAIPEIEGVHVIDLTPHPDERGSFTEVYRRSWIPGMREMVQANLSLSRAGVLRGMHFHRRQADYWVVAAGTCFIGLYDLRHDSPTEGRTAEIRIVAEEQRRAVYIPKGVGHGYYAETDVWLQYLVDEYFSGDDEFSFAWDDPDAGIAWPATSPILSVRDRANPPVALALADPPAFER